MSKNTNLSFLTDYITADITNGRIGINNASPTVAFDVSGATRISGALTLTSTISNGTYTYTLPSATGTLALTSALSSYLPLSGGTLMGALSGTSANFSSSVTANGNIIISKDSPHISLYANTGTSGQYNINNSSGTLHWAMYSTIGGGGSQGNWGLYSLGKTGGAGSVMEITPAGNVGIGTTAPNYTLHIDANTTLTRFQITNSTTGQGGGVGLQIIQNGLDAIITNRSNGYLSFETVGTERMRITSAGNVGIGTSSPSYSLHVNGTSYAIGYIGGYVTAFSGYVNETQTITTNGTSYYLRKYTGTSNGSSSTIFNITGLNTVNGTFADIYAIAQKDATGSAINTNVEVQINGQYMYGIQAGGTGANTVICAFKVCRMESSWVIIGTVRT